MQAGWAAALGPHWRIRYVWLTASLPMPVRLPFRLSAARLAAVVDSEYFHGQPSPRVTRPKECCPGFGACRWLGQPQLGHGL